MNQAVETSDAPNIDRFVFGGGLLLLAGIVLAAPDVVVDIHRENIAAGAQVITANTYGVIRSDLEKVGLAAAAEPPQRISRQSGKGSRREKTLPEL